MTTIRLMLCATIVHCAIRGAEAMPVALVKNDSPMRAFVPTNNTLGLSWTGANEPFDDSGWVAGPQGVGFDTASQDYDPLIGTNVLQMRGTSSTIFMRIPFNVADPSQLQQLRVSVDYDDGFVGYLNGIEFGRANAPAGTPTWQSLAPIALGVPNEPGLYELDVTFLLPNLRAGENTLAIFGMNSSVIGSTDFLIRARLDAEAAVPEPTSGSLLLLTAITVAIVARRRPAGRPS
jgi:hypothetical protein